MSVITVHKSPLYSTLQFLRDLHKWVISFKSKLSLYCPNKIDHIFFSNHFGPNPEVHSKTWQTSKMECFAKIVYSFQSLTVFARLSILDVWQGSGLQNYFAVLSREELKLKIQICLMGLSVGKTWKVSWNFFLEGKNLNSQSLVFVFWGHFLVSRYENYSAYDPVATCIAYVYNIK